jgi:hypothetical protein
MIGKGENRFFLFFPLSSKIFLKKGLTSLTKHGKINTVAERVAHRTEVSGGQLIELVPMERCPSGLRNWS